MARAILALIVLGGAPVRADERHAPGAPAAPAATPPPALERFELDPIVVTAPSLGGQAERAPASFTVLSGPELEAAGSETTADLRTRAPTLVVQEAGDRRSNFFSIRGFGNTPGAGPSVGLYVDGIPYADQRASILPLLDLDAVEVLRGPQNFRFGRSADGGAINLRTARPPALPRARAAITYGDFDTQIYEAGAGGPIVADRAYISLAGLSSRRDGYIENAFLDESLDDRDLLAGRGKLLLLPTPELEVELIGEAQYADEGGRGLVLRGSADPFEVAYDTPGGGRTDGFLGALRLIYEARRFHLTSLTARRTFDADHSRFDLDFSPQDLLVLIDDHANIDWSQELRATSPDPEARWRWQLGFFFEDAVQRPEITLQANDTALVQAPPPLGFGLPFEAPVADRQQAETTTRTYAGFGEISTTVLAPFEISAGLRYQYDDVSMERVHVLEAPSAGETVPTTPPFDLDTSGSAWLPQLTVAYRFRPQVLTYATVARGYRAPGFSHLVDDASAARFAAQREWSWETGCKGSWLDDRLATEAALFYVLASDFQVVRRIGLSSFRVLNADGVTSRGVEAALRARPWTGFEASAAVGYIDAEYDDFTLPDGGSRLDGNDVQLVPPYTFALALAYRHPSGLLARIDYQGVGSFDFTEDNTSGQDAYELLDVHVGWAGKRFGASVFGKNLADVTYFPFAIPDGPGGDLIVSPAPPRTFGMAVTAAF